MTRPVAQQLHDAWKRSDLTLDQLLEKARQAVPKKYRGLSPAPLSCDFTSLSRKLSGKQSMSIIEAEALATALGVELEWGVEAVTARVGGVA